MDGRVCLEKVIFQSLLKKLKKNKKILHKKTKRLGSYEGLSFAVIFYYVVYLFMRQAIKGHVGCACAGKHDFVAHKTPKMSHCSRINEKI